MAAPDDAHPVRLARSGTVRPARPVRLSVRGSRPSLSEDRANTVRRENRGATQRAVRLSILFAAGIALVYGFLVDLAVGQPTGGSAGSWEWIWVVGLLAVVVGAVGVLVTLGAVPRSVELGERTTVVVGRFGRLYWFPGRSELRTKVLRRFPAGFLTPVALESVEISAGSARRSFLLEAGLLHGAEPAAEPESGAAA